MTEVIFDKEKHTYTYGDRKLPSVTQIINECGLGADFSSIASSDLEWYAKRGTMVHLACEYFDEGRLNWHSLDKRLVPYVESYQRFHERYVEKVLESELIVSDRLARYAGTLDRIYRLKEPLNFPDSRIVQIDIKSGQPHKNHGYQTAGYNICLDGDWIEWDRHICRYGLYLNKRGGEPTLIHYPSLRDFVVFESAVNIWYAKNEQ